MFEPGNFDYSGKLGSDQFAVEEVLLDQTSVHNALEGGHESAIAKILPIGILLGFLVIFGQVFNLQIVKGGDYYVLAEGNRIRTIQNFAPRGLITDRYGEVIARNTPSFELVTVPQDLPKDETVRNELITKLSGILSMTSEEIESKIGEVDVNIIQPVTIKENLSQAEALQLEDLVSKTSGIQVQSAPIREYLDGPAFAQLIGYVGKLNREEWETRKNKGYYFNDVLGKSGLESVYESLLRGQHGGTQVEVDASGNVVKKLSDKNPVAGEDLVLTIDAGLQKTLYRSLEQTLRGRPSASGAAAIATHPETGEILSLVSLPSFDNNLFAKGITSKDYSALLNNKRRPLLNRAIAGAYPPGSTIKPLIAAAALQEGVITERTTVKDEGFIKLGNFTFYGWDRDGLGVMNVISALAQSSDPYFYVIGGGYEGFEGLGVSRIAKYLKQFHLGEKLGINLPGEASGFVPTAEWKKERFAGTDEASWYQGNTYHLSIGQGFLLTTPLQVTAFTAGIANNGKIMKPVLTKEEKPGVASNMNIDGKNLEIVKRGMRENVLTGSGVRLLSLPISAAGKTGTAQFDDRNPGHTHAWYTGFAPYEDPKIAITVFVEGGGEGHAVAVPVVESALKWWAENRLPK